MKNSLFLKLFATSLAVSAVTLTTLASTEVFSEVHGSPETQLMSIPNSNEWFILSEDNDLSGIMLPESNVSVAEAVVLVSRMNAIYNNNEIDMVSGDKGYDMYIDYAIENGLIQEGQFTNYDRNIMRYEFVQMFANALPAHCYQPINDINSIPDVAETEEYYDDLMMLYEAGVVMGTDEYGSFLATNPIKKYEMAQIINRAVLPENRKSGTLSEFGARKPAVYLIEDLDMWCEPGGFKHIDSGWTYENPLSSSISNLEYSTKQLVDFSNEEKVTIRKEVTTVDTGIVTLEVSYNVSNLGSRLYFEDLEGNLLFELFNDDNVFYAIGDKKTSTQYDFIDGRVILKVEMDLDSREARVIINSTDVGVYDMSTSASDLSRLIISTTEEDEVCITVDSVFLYWNYDVNENFYHGKAGTVPFGWQVDNALLKTINSDYDKISFNINGQGSASKTFNKVSDTFVYETYFVVPEGQDATLAIMNGSKTALAVNAKDGVITTADGTLVRNYNTNVWQQLRVEADTAKDTALVKINGKKCLTVPFTEDGIDNIVISTAGTGDFYFDDVKVFNTFDYPDYCPVPVPVNDDEWYSGMSVCSLWREGSHFGWDSISPYEDITPVLGYYDEGIAEVADWEIKFMVEHGYDYQRFCWYQGGFNDNIKKPSTCDDAIHDGYFNAKYSDMLDFSIMWENVGYDGTMDDFCNGIWPYWVDWYLTDERYFCIDNKPVISIYSHQQFMKTMDGTVEGVKAAINFMDAECKNLGFDGVIVYVSDSSSNAAFNQELAECGYDAKAAYHFDELAYTADYQKTRMLDAFDAGHITLSASVGIGFNNIGWTETRTPLATAEEFEEILRWSKEVYLPMYADRAVDDWHTKSILTNTWNEYGEGHYVFPSGLNGFGYMDAHRRVFSSVAGTEDSEHFDVVPTDNQKARLGYLYSARRIPMRKTYLVEEDYSKYERVKTWDFESSEDCNLWKVLAKVTDLGYDSEEKALVGTTTTNDGHISIKSLPENYFNADDARWLHIRIKIDPCESNRIDVFFSNVSSDSANASIAAYIPAYSDGEYHDYYFDLSSIATWDGEIRGIRFDPASAIAKFYIKTIEFISEKTVNFKSFEIDGVAFTMDEDNYSVVDDELFICANPSAGFYNLNQFYYEWNRWNGTLLIRANDGTQYEFVVGSDRVLVNGVEQTLNKAIEVNDGLVEIPITFIYDTSGYNYTVDGNDIKVVIKSDNIEQEIHSRVKNEFEFNVPNDLEGWTIYNGSGEVNNGYVKFAPFFDERYNSYDPQLYKGSLSIDTEVYNSMTIRLKPEFDEDDGGQKFYLFFTTTNDASMNVDKRVVYDMSTETPDEEGFITLTLNLKAHSKWNGICTSVRVDPEDRKGTFTIDYIRFNIDHDYLLTLADQGRPFYVKNADAELPDIASEFGSVDTHISVVDDDLRPGNRAFLVTTDIINSQVWTYMIIPTRFKPGVTYKVDYEIRVLGDVSGNPASNVEMYTNFMYSDYNSSGTYYNTMDHSFLTARISSSDGWVPVSITHTVSEASPSRADDLFSVFASPTTSNNRPVNYKYMIDNIKVTVVE